MRLSLFLLFVLLTIASCKNQADQKMEITSEPEVKRIKNYPETLTKVFDAHGSLEKWKDMKTLSYEIVRESGNEKQWVDLINRNERIEASTFKTGYDGTNYWLEADTTYKGNPKFYKNLMFYFYAMPFVVADDGIIYSETEALQFEDKSYPGVKISYDAGVGISPEDEYFIHYNPDTYQMEWLGYTVTFFTGEKSKKVKWIRYNDWGAFDGLVLPNSMTWYQMEEDKITEPRTPTQFTNIKISKDKRDQQFFAKTENASIVE
ncbi:MAG: DUF6503 family protein [Bacteroidota bacterium]